MAPFMVVQLTHFPENKSHSDGLVLSQSFHKERIDTTSMDKTTVRRTACSSSRSSFIYNITITTLTGRYDGLSLF